MIFVVAMQIFGFEVEPKNKIQKCVVVTIALILGISGAIITLLTAYQKINEIWGISFKEYFIALSVIIPGIFFDIMVMIYARQIHRFFQGIKLIHKLPELVNNNSRKVLKNEKRNKKPH